MPFKFIRIAILPLLASSLRAAIATEADPPGWKLVWSDEFDGTTIDKTKWDFDHGNGFVGADGKTTVGGWGNGELEYYTDRPENAFVKDGMLHICAIREAFKNCKYTSARLKTRKDDKSPLFNKLYGKFEFRAKLPLGKGIWPAIWMLSQDEKYKGWAASGEIDILEARGDRSPAKKCWARCIMGRAGRHEHAHRQGLRLSRTKKPRSRIFTSTRWNGSRAKSAGLSMASCTRRRISGGAAANATVRKARSRRAIPR